ncbi:MAG: glycosyltransferase family 4 protein [Candidatus Nanopelagicales bacterium]
MSRILHVSWEYPPLVYGGLGRHVHALAEAQAELGHEVTVLTQSVQGAPDDSVANGVRVVRVPRDPPAVPFDEEHLLAWVLSMETAMTRRGEALVVESAPQVVHAHDWMVAHAAVALRDASGAALVATIHATEAGRHQGWLPTELSGSIHTVEDWLLHQADRVIACSHHMRGEIQGLHDVDIDRLDVVANGIDLDRWMARPLDVETARASYAASGPLVVFCGRLEWEKGVHTLIDAIPRLHLPGLRVVIAGRGGAMEDLRQQVRKLRVSSAVTFAGWIPERELHGLMTAADALVVPSIYEPFGLVALEGAALSAPLVVARTGGLAEFVRDGETGRTFVPGDADDLARAVTEAVLDHESSRAMASAARERLRTAYRWEILARRTDEAYARAMADAGRVRPPFEPPVIPAREVNLLRD